MLDCKTDLDQRCRQTKLLIVRDIEDGRWEMSDFQGFEKIPRLSREIVVTEKIDGTNGQILFKDDGSYFVGSRNRWITPQDDNYGFAKWVESHLEDLRTLGPGAHFGEWYGQGIQHGYGMKEKRFALFNSARWSDVRPRCCNVVPVLYTGIFEQAAIEQALLDLKLNGSHLVPGFMRPEGIIIYHTAARMMFKKTILKDDEYKGKSA